MVRRFTARDTLRLRRLSAGGTVFEVENVVLLGHSPLRQAVAGYWRLGNAHVDTFVQDPSEPGGAPAVAQLRRRRATPVEADLVFVSPALGCSEGGALSWQRLIGGACQHLAGHGVERVFAAVHEEDTIALQVLRQLGFTVVTGDVVFVRVGDAAEAAASSALHVVVPRVDHVVAVRRMLQEALPEAARLAGGTWGDDWLDYPAGGHALGAAMERVCLDDRGDVCGAWRLLTGSSGVWLRVAGRPGSDVTPVVGHALAARAADVRFQQGAIYATARGYEPELNLALREYGFEARARRFRLVRHLAARVLSPAWEIPTVRGRDLRHVPSSSLELPAARIAPAHDAGHGGERA